MTINKAAEMSEESEGNAYGHRVICSARQAPFEELFSHNRLVELMSIERMAEWFKNRGKGRLRLPPIQRSFIWRNEQILNYWDSLMRGYPAGMMMVVRVSTDGPRRYGVGIDSKTEELSDTDFHLFDGQQRLVALLLGLGEGSLGDSLRIWVDIGAREGSGDRLYELRINSTGQPFGYKTEAPNEKIRAEERRDAHRYWPTEDGKPKPPEMIFIEMAKYPVARLSSAKCAVSLSYILKCLMSVGKEKTANNLRAFAAQRTDSAAGADIDSLLARLEEALNAKIIVKLIDSAVMDAGGYERFFGRLGQGGTRLSDEELTFSLIKDRYPKVRDRVERIVSDTGRFASEVDLVLGALRVAQILAPWPGAKEWEKVGRPTPDRVQKLHDKGGETTEPSFCSMLPEDDSAPVRLKTAVSRLRGGLLYDPTSNSLGLPAMLLARLPRDLLDVLLLFAFKRGEEQKWEGEDRAILIAFVLYWLIFVADDVKAADHSFEEGQVADWYYGRQSIAALVRHFEAEGVARHAPRAVDWGRLTEEVQQRGDRLAPWAERFSSRDSEGAVGHPSPGDALRVLSTHDELRKRALIWLQRRYITQTFPHYDPTSSRDDDLPFDLDHVIPHGLFGGNWTKVKSRICLSARSEAEFRECRHTVGNSLGNLRWLAAADNRGRGMGPIEPERPRNGDAPPLDDYIDRSSWNELISEGGNAKTWTEEDVAGFQRLIDSRTLLLTRILMDEGGITDLVNAADGINTSPTPARNVRPCGSQT